MMPFNETLFTICSGTGLIGAMSGFMGSWLFLQRKSLFGDTIAHATLPGITLFFYCTLQKSPLFLFLAGLASALGASTLITLIGNRTSLKKDTILGIVLTSCFGIGTILLSKIQLISTAQQAGITKYLLGNPATIMHQDIALIAISSICIIIIILPRLYPYSIMVFDHDFATSIKINNQKNSLIMLICITVIITLGLQAVGIILMSALLINPAAAAYQWTRRYQALLILATILGASSAIMGTIISFYIQDLTTGPVIVLCSTTITIFSLLFSPFGIITIWIKRRKQQQDISHAALLSRFLLFNEGSHDPYHPHDLKALDAIGKKMSQKDLIQLAHLGYIVSTQPNFWCLTKQGFLLVQRHLHAKKS